MSTARRYSLHREDAEDAYQRTFEILFGKTTSDDPKQNLPWLHTVIKNEARTVRRHREKLLTESSFEPDLVSDYGSSVDRQNRRRDSVRSTASSVSRLKKQELKCLLLQAGGYSYDEITDLTEYSWTKVNRSVSEGRSRLRQLDHGWG